MPQTQEEFYFALPYARMDLCLYAYNHGVPSSEVAGAVALEPDQVERVFRDIEAKRRATRYLHAPPLLVARFPMFTLVRSTPDLHDASVATHGACVPPINELVIVR